MADIIQLLPDSVANQIAAGEVIQRPASVVKELMENSVDAGSTVISVYIREAGKNLVQVTDNGCGMSETDARLSAERHATSKIREASDLFAIKTMGFRGEALASIAAVAELEIQTKRSCDEVGTLIGIRGSDIVKQEPSACQSGSRFTVRNLFFNVPARRKFLKVNSTELKHIITEFQRIALANPQIEFSLSNEGTEILHLPPAGYRQRIIHTFGKNINQHLVEIKTETSVATIKGYIAKPEYAKKSTGEQFFFINSRFMRHPWMHKAVIKAYEKLIPPDTIPSYFIWFEADPASIDVNIHPTKTEIKFENEKAVWQILLASVREALGKFNLVPSIDFDTEGRIDIPLTRPGNEPSPPDIKIDPGYNPFDIEPGGKSRHSRQESLRSRIGNWEDLYSGFDSEKAVNTPEQAITAAGSADAISDAGNLRDKDLDTSGPALMQLKGRYILSPVKSGLMIIDQKRAHERILYEKLLKKIRTGSLVAQQQLYPVTMGLSPTDYQLLKELKPDLAAFGFDIRDFGRNTIIISGCPVETGVADPAEMIGDLLAAASSQDSSLSESKNERIAFNLARSSAINYGKQLNREEMQEIVDKLFACDIPSYSPDGKPVITIINHQEIEKKFGRPQSGNGP